MLIYFGFYSYHKYYELKSMILSFKKLWKMLMNKFHWYLKINRYIIYILFIYENINTLKS